MLHIKSGWINDPNGMIRLKKTYHLYFQSLPGSSSWKLGIGWGHASSTDMKHWNIDQHRILEPSTKYDQDGCFSGSAIVENDKVYTLYTGVRNIDKRLREYQCMAVSDDGDHFHKFSQPFIENPPVENVYGWRDPFIFKYNNTYFLLIGSGWNQQGHILLYEGLGNTLPCTKWIYKDILISVDEDLVLECPFICQYDDDTWILGASCDGKNPIYWLGDFNGDAFNIKSKHYKQLIDAYGHDIYAPTIVTDDDKHYFWTWIRNTKVLRGPCEIMIDKENLEILPLI
jgi:beta-fructofuranosidase